MSRPSPALALVFSSVGHVFAHLLMLLYPTVVLALTDVFAMPYGELLALATPGFIAFGAGALPAGWLGDRWSASGMLTVFFVGSGTAAVLTGLARTPVEIALGLTLIGLFASIYHPVGIAWVVRHATRRGRALGINGMAGNIGVAAAALVAGGLADLVSWRAAFLVPGAVAIAVGVAFALATRGEQAPRAEGGGGSAEAAGRATIARGLAVLLVAALCGGLIFQANTVGLPKVFDERLPNLAGGIAGVGAMVSIVFALAGLAQVIVGTLMDRIDNRKLFVAVYLAQAPLLLVAAVLWDLPLLLVAIAFVFLNVGAQPVSDGLIARFTPPAWRARAYGTKFMVALGVSALGVPMVGVIHDLSGGFAWLYAVLAGLALVVTVAGLFLPAGRRPAIAAE